jgi:two-component system OmpR family sensor kinase
MKPRSPRPGKLRTQVLAGVLLITIGALAVFDVAAVTALRTYLIDRTNVTLKSALSWTRPQLNELLPARRRSEAQVSLPVFGEYYIAFVPARGRVVNLQGGPGLKTPTLSATAAAGMVRPALANARATVKVGPDFTVQQYQLSAVSVPAFSGTLVAGTNLKDVDATVDRVRLIVATGSAAVAVLIFLGVGLVMRRGLRPIEVMASQADRITAGDLTNRIDPAEVGSEVGRLGAALNGMLARIEASVAEGEASQELMRRFLAEASHELRTPLASLRANAELYTQGALTERSQVDEAMRRIMLEAQRMGRLVDDMLRLARLDQHPARQHEPVDVSALAAGCVERTRIADPRRTWQARIAPGLVAVGDEELLCRAVDNLLANVHAHTPEGTAAVITAREAGDSVVVEVSDNGPGVPADRLPRIFDRFYRAGTTARRPGSGLGLAIVTEIAAAHDGTVTAAAVWPRGLRVTLAVPAWRSADTPDDQLERADSLGRHHDDDGAPDPDLVALLQPLGDDEAAPVEPGAVGRAEVLDVPEAVSRLEEGMMAGGVLVVDNQGALSAGGELGVEDAGLVSGLDDDRLGGPGFGEGGVALAGDGRHGGPPGLLFLLAGVFPGRERPRVSAAVSLVGGTGKTVEVGASHKSIMPEGRGRGSPETQEGRSMRLGWSSRLVRILRSYPPSMPA